LVKSRKAQVKITELMATNADERNVKFWRSLGELEASPEFRANALHEFPHGATREPETLSRRDVLRLGAASAALAGLSACTKLPTEKIVPYAQEEPEDFIPGKPLYYATAMTLGGVAQGVLAESHMGRPTKIEGNPDHPASLGATDVFMQASVLDLYDPDRSQVILRDGRIGSWSDFLNTITSKRGEWAAKKGAGLTILTETVTSPTLADQLRALLEQFPLARWHQYEPCGGDAAREGARLAFGEVVNTVYRLDRADVILSLDADFLCTGPGSLRYARDFAEHRRITGPDSTMNRLYVVESSVSGTGSIADHRWPVQPSMVERIARAVANGVGLHSTPQAMLLSVPYQLDWLRGLIQDLKAHRGTSVVIAGDTQPPAVHALAHALNEALGNVGQTVYYTAPLEAEPTNQMRSLIELVKDTELRRVETLVILGGNPAYTAPADLDFGGHLLNVPLRIHLGIYEDETAALCHWHVPVAHDLESWGDARAYDGMVSIIQPLIAPLYNGTSAYEVLTVLAGQPGRTGHEIVRDYWQRQNLAADFEPFWEKSLHDGFIAGTAFEPKTATLKNDFLTAPPAMPASPGRDAVEVSFRPDPAVWDGRFANNAWLQELPKPFTKLTWENAILIGPGLARRLGVTTTNDETTDILELTYEGEKVQGLGWIVPGHPDDSVTVHFGYGRTRSGRVGTGIGFNAYSIWKSGTGGFGSRATIAKTGRSARAATTQQHHSIEQESETGFKRNIIQAATLAEFRKHPNFACESEALRMNPPPFSLYPEVPAAGHAWGMSVDLNCCVGCNACVTACRSENNIAVVGKEEVARGREMDWLRIDTYYEGLPGSSRAHNQPVFCMHCENAPCEVVCPVGATVHSPEGLNEMVYNRCVGTRYCSNNCPYKVRRFNFKVYADFTTPSLFGLRNPNVTVRSRGVMEKCTYCVQRINAAKIRAEEENREVKDGEILTACQQACPTEAIVFGDIRDPNSAVSKLKAQSRNYGLLTDLNTRPRTTYLARIRNTNPEIEG
jgi:MoCo/4Fe-4S cofactor protein with predicted Tat translocation signal